MGCVSPFSFFFFPPPPLLRMECRHVACLSPLPPLLSPPFSPPTGKGPKQNTKTILFFPPLFFSPSFPPLELFTRGLVPITPPPFFFFHFFPLPPPRYRRFFRKPFPSFLSKFPPFFPFSFPFPADNHKLKKFPVCLLFFPFFLFPLSRR